jgi:transcriptional regulator with XRE-family HTH domain
MTRAAQETRLRCLRDGAPAEPTVDAILRAVPGIFPLEAWRFAHGWTRAEVSARLDALYEADELAPPGITSAELCRWEHEQRRPGDERVEYLCRLYGTRPDRLGFGVDYGAADLDHLQRAGISNLWPRTDDESLADLVSRLRGARAAVTLFGLTRNFYAREEVLPIFEATAVRIPVRLYVMDPRCASRRDRYRIEPAEAAMEDPGRYAREILRPLRRAAQRIGPAAAPGAGLEIFTYNFPCSFAIEQVDDSCRVMLYGHGVRGTDGPILVFDRDTPYHGFFDAQLRWLRQLAEDPREPWTAKGLVVRPLSEGDLDP